MGSAETILPALSDYVECYAHTPSAKVRLLQSQCGDDAALLACEWLVQKLPRS